MTIGRVLPLAIVLFACAGTVPPRGEPSGERGAAEELDRRSAELDRQLSALSADPARPDCRRICELGDRICDLSERICAISRRHPDDPDLGGRCLTSRERCERSRGASRACGCR